MDKGLKTRINHIKLSLFGIPITKLTSFRVLLGRFGRYFVDFQQILGILSAFAGTVYLVAKKKKAYSKAYIAHLAYKIFLSGLGTLLNA